MTKKTNGKNVEIKIIAAVVVGGRVASPGAVVSVPKRVAMGLVYRGRAEYFEGEKDIGTLENEEPDEKNIASLKKAELVELANSKGIETDGLNVPDLRSAIEAAAAKEE